MAIFPKPRHILVIKENYESLVCFLNEIIQKYCLIKGPYTKSVLEISSLKQKKYIIRFEF